MNPWLIATQPSTTGPRGLQLLAASWQVGRVASASTRCFLRLGIRQCSSLPEDVLCIFASRRFLCLLRLLFTPKVPPSSPFRTCTLLSLPLSLSLSRYVLLQTHTEAP